MTSVSTRPQTPHTAGYEQRQSLASAGHENGTGASGNAEPQDYFAPRPSMTPEQRGQFSSHNKIVNPRHSEVADTAGQVAELTEKNRNLVAKYNALVEKLSATLIEFSKKIENLTQQFSPSGKQTEEAPVASGPPPHRRADAQTAAPEIPSPQDSQVTEQNQVQGFETLVAETTQLQNAFNKLLEGFNLAIKALAEKMDNLTQMLSKGVPQNPAATVQSDTTETATSYDVSPETTAPSQNENSILANDSVAPAPGTLEYLRQENKKLEEQIDHMTDYFDRTMSVLEQQFKTLSEQANGQVM